jgi:hypothetical protein
MKPKHSDEDDDDMLPEYDFSQAVRNKHAAAYRESHTLPDWHHQPNTLQNRQWQYVILLAVLAVFAVGLLWAVFSFLGGLAGNAIESEGEAIAQTLDAFMQAMTVGDTDTAAQLVDPERGPLDQGQLAAMLVDERAVAFDGYRRTELESFGLITAPQINSGEATLVGARGRMWYDERYMGTFEATLVRQGDDWRVVDISIVVPPTKPRP